MKTRLTRDLVDRISRAMARGDTLEMIAFRERLSRKTLYSWRRGDLPKSASPELRKYFTESIETAEAQLLKRLRRNIDEAGDDPEVARRAAWILIKRFPGVAAQMGVVPTNEHGLADTVVAAVDEIMTNTDGKPLGIVSAQARTKSTSPAEIEDLADDVAWDDEMLANVRGADGEQITRAREDDEQLEALAKALEEERERDDERWLDDLG